LIELNTTNNDNTKPVIVEELIIPPKTLEVLHTIMNGKLSSRSKDYAIKQLIHASSCHICGNQIPTKKVIYDASDGARLVEYYDDKCYQRWVVETDPDKDKVLLTATNGKDKTIAVVEKGK
jgi:hypothetical protein